MLTIFACPKPFTDRHIRTIQRNAIRSWTLLEPRPEILLFGDEAGVAETAAGLGLRHCPEVARNEFGTPLVSDLFERAQKTASHGILCYVNADIILMDDFAKAVRRMPKQKREFLMVGRRWNLDVPAKLSFEPNWQEALRSRALDRGQLGSAQGIDYFVFSRDLYWGVPPMALGRMVWDNWLIWRARIERARVVDATLAVMAIHQNHKYRCDLGGEADILNGPEGRLNLELAGGWSHMFTVDDSTHALTAHGTRRSVSYRDFRLYVFRLPVFHPWLQRPVQILDRCRRVVKGMRRLPPIHQQSS